MNFLNVVSFTGTYELKHSHLSRGILHGDTVRSKPEIAGSPLDLLLGRLVQMRVQNFFRQGQWSSESKNSL